MNRCLPAYSLGVLLQWAYQLAPFLPDFVALNFPFAPSYGSRVPSIPLRWPLKHKLPVPERIFALLAERPLRILLRPVPYELRYVAGTLRRIPKRRNPELLTKRPGFCGISPSKLNCPPGKRLRWGVQCTDARGCQAVRYIPSALTRMCFGFVTNSAVFL